MHSGVRRISWLLHGFILPTTKSTAKPCKVICQTFPLIGRSFLLCFFFFISPSFFFFLEGRPSSKIVGEKSVGRADGGVKEGVWMNDSWGPRRKTDRREDASKGSVVDFSGPCWEPGGRAGEPRGEAARQSNGRQAPPPEPPCPAPHGRWGQPLAPSNEALGPLAGRLSGKCWERLNPPPCLHPHHVPRCPAWAEHSESEQNSPYTDSLSSLFLTLSLRHTYSLLLG